LIFFFFFVLLPPLFFNLNLVIESVNAEQIKRANEAIEELSKLINHYFGVESSQVFHLTEDNPTAVVPK